MPRKKMSDEEKMQVSNRMKKYWAQRRAETTSGKPRKKTVRRKASNGKLGEEILVLKKQTLQAAKFIESCGTTERAKDVFGLVIDLAEKIS